MFLGSAVGGTTTHLRSSLFPAALVIVFFLASGSANRLLPGDLFTASNRHCIEQDDYFDKAPCRLRMLPAQPLGIISSNVLLISLSKL
jgi:hypothetical protein